MKRLLLIVIPLCFYNASLSQSRFTKSIDSFLHLLQNAKEDTDKVILLGRLSRRFAQDNPDTAMLLVKEGFVLAEKADFEKGKARLLSGMGDIYLSLGDYTKALEIQLKSLDIYNKIKAPSEAGPTLHALAVLYQDQQEMRLALSYYLKENETLKIHPDAEGWLWNLTDIAKIYAILGIYDSSRSYSDKAIELGKHFYGNTIPGDYLNTLGDIYNYRGENQQAFMFYRESLPHLKRENAYREICESYIGLARLFKKTGNTDSSIYFAKQVLRISQAKELLLPQITAASFISALYKSLHNIDSAFFYHELSTKIQDSLFSRKKIIEFQNILFSRQIEQIEIRSVHATYQSRLKTYILLASLVVLSIIVGGLWRKNIYKQKSYALLQKQKQEIDLQKLKVEKTYEELKSTQAQLIQSEKMASLGELTAGIAHEIQNPLNFVNNFSEVNTELIDEMQKEIDKGNLEDAKAISNDIKENGQKINQHGKRADAIVKGMLQHSRSSSGHKEPTNINAMVNEYLRLSWHGLRAKDPGDSVNKSFNATFKTDFDSSIGKINVIPQDIGRVLLNLYNNAFYAVTEKKRQQPEGYEPTVSVSTKKIGETIEIRIKDNGNGISQKILEKIFQPFFTTKPSGQGTGLGLSLSNDIVKAHGGGLKVETKEGQGSEFVIRLPV